MIAELLIGIAALALLRKRKSASGVGKLSAKRPKRRIYHEIEAAQKKGIDLHLPYDSDDDQTLKALATEFGFRPSGRSTKTIEEQYFNSLRKAYNAIAGIGIGRTYLPYRESSVINENGDVILTYRDYGTSDQKLNNAYDYIREIPIVDAVSAYWHTLVYLASGGKLLWKNRKSKSGTYLSRGVSDIVGDSERERKARISYLGTPQKGAISLDQLAHQLWESSRNTSDDVIYNGVEEAVLRCTSRRMAQEEILKFYYDAHKAEEEYYNENVPF